MRALTIQEELRLVSKSQLKTLNSGTPVNIVWANGEGPYRYTLNFKSGLPFAIDSWGHEHLINTQLVGFNDTDERIMRAS
ncbi:MAG: hypothetical protein HOM11_17005 [Methylococcales bacterium]|jgi:hypothetical protein|nr:hypothetical protein [Methylococcales bacterium]MBT7442956.1 hypothetical protein [Methylococcales bacterium]